MRKTNSTIAALLAVLATACSGDDANSSTGAPANNGGNGGSDGGGQSGGGGGGNANTNDAGDAATGANCLGTQTTDEKFSQAMAALHKNIRDAGLKGGAIAVIQDGRLSNIGVVGTKRGTECDPITPDTLFYTGAATSPFITALAIMDAVEEGKLSLTAPITDYVPNITPTSNADVSQITLRDLLTGSGNYSVEKDESNQGSDCSPSLDAAFTNARNPILKAKPGTLPSEMFNDWELAGLALEKADGKPFPDVVTERVLSKLSMGGTFDPATILASDHAVGHIAGIIEQEVSPAKRCPNFDPSSGYWGSIRDAAKLAEYLLGGPGGILDQASLDTMLSKQGPAFWSLLYHTYGASGFTTADEELVAMDSLGRGFQTEFRIYKKSRLAVITYLNSEPNSGYVYGSVWPSTVVTEAVAEIYHPSLKAFHAAYRGPSVYPPDPTTLPTLIGTYRDDVGFRGIKPRTLDVFFEGGDAASGNLAGTLSGSDGTKNDVVIEGAWSKDNFRFTVGPNKYEARFWRDDTGNGSAVQLYADSGPPFMRVP